MQLAACTSFSIAISTERMPIAAAQIDFRRGSARPIAWMPPVQRGPQRCRKRTWIDAGRSGRDGPAAEIAPHDNLILRSPPKAGVSRMGRLLRTRGVASATLVLRDALASQVLLWMRVGLTKASASMSHSSQSRPIARLPRACSKLDMADAVPIPFGWWSRVDAILQHFADRMTTAYVHVAARSRTVLPRHPILYQSVGRQGVRAFTATDKADLGSGNRSGDRVMEIGGVDPLVRQPVPIPASDEAFSCAIGEHQTDGIRLTRLSQRGRSPPRFG